MVERVERRRMGREEKVKMVRKGEEREGKEIGESEKEHMCLEGEGQNK
jgi:hypothetical protein